MEKVRAIFVEFNAGLLVVLAKGIAADMGTTINNQNFFIGVRRNAFCNGGPEKPGTDNDYIELGKVQNQPLPVSYSATVARMTKQGLSGDLSRPPLP